jgi:cytochrome c-type biogenesis protein CcmH/NrfG
VNKVGLVTSCVCLVSSFLLAAAIPGPADKERTVTVLEQAVKTDPSNAELWVHLGFAHHKLGQTLQAQSAFEKARSLDPRNRDALFMLGLIYEKNRQTPEALQAWKEYLAAETDHVKRGIAEKHIHHLSQ